MGGRGEATPGGVERAGGRPGRSLLGGTARVTLAEALIVPTGLATTAFLSRRLGASDYGLLTVAATFISWVEWTIASLFSRAAVRHLAEAADRSAAGAIVVRLHVVVGAAAGLAVALLAGPLARLLGAPAVASVLRILAAEIPLFSLAQAHRCVLVGTGDYDARATTAAVRLLMRMLLIIALVGSGLGVAGAALGLVGASLAELVACRAFARPPLFGRIASGARRLLGDAAPLFAFSMSLRLYERIDLLLVEALGGSPADAGYYGAAVNLAQAPNLFGLAFAPLLLSSLTRLEVAGEAEAARRVGVAALRGVAALLPMAGLAAGAAPEVVATVLGPGFGRAAPLLSWLSFAYLGLILLSIAAVVLTAGGRPGRAAWISGPMTAAATAGHLVMVPAFGADGAALVTTLGAGIGAAAGVLAVWRLWGILPPTGTVIRAAGLCAVAWAWARAWPTHGALLVVKLAAIGAAVPLGYWLLGEFTEAEADRVRAAIRRWATP